jgi:hypothetical protein
MSQYVKDTDGNIYRVSEDSKVTREQLVGNQARALELLKNANAELEAFDVLTVVQTPEAPVETPAPVVEQPEAPAPTSEPVSDTITFV